MTPAEVITFLRQLKEWRRGNENIPQLDARDIGKAIDAAVEMIERLEAAEKNIAMKERMEKMEAALRIAVRQNSHDMLMTGPELRQCEAALEESK